MEEHKRQDNMLERIQSTLDESVDNLDGEIQSRITQARYNALEQNGKREKNALLLPLGALASVCTLVLALSIYLNSGVEISSPVEDIEMMTNIDDLELLEELEFYEWLEEYELPT